MYYRSNLLYQPGDRIDTGLYARQILGFGPNHLQFFREYMLEQIRKAEFPERPSRLSVVFIYESFELSQRVRRSPIADEITYRVTPVNADTLVCRLDMDWLTHQLEHCHSFECAEAIARKYWKGERAFPGSTTEMLVSGPVVIEERMTAITENGYKQESL